MSNKRKVPDLTVSDAAKLIGVSGGRVRQLLLEKPQKLIGTKHGQHGVSPWVISAAAVAKFIKRREARRRTRTPSA